MLRIGSGSTVARIAYVRRAPYDWRINLILCFKAWSTPTGTNSIPVGAFGVPAWAWSSVAVDSPSNPQSTFLEHNDCTSTPP